MALKVGSEDKKKVIAVAVLMTIAVGVAIYEFADGSSTPAPAPVRAPVVVRLAPAVATGTVSGARTSGTVAGPEAKKRPGGSGLDPSLHLERLALSESIEYAGDGRNIFSADSAPMPIPEPIGPARGKGMDVAQDTGPPPPPQAPAIDLHYFGYSATKDGKREAFLSKGDDVFEASAGEIVNHRYKVVAVDLHSIQITDLSYNNTQTLQLQQN
jgi:hypothetical protein